MTDHSGPKDLPYFLTLARDHGSVTDTAGWVSDLEDMLGVAWELLSEDQRKQFQDHPTILAIAEAAGDLD